MSIYAIVGGFLTLFLYGWAGTREEFAQRDWTLAALPMILMAGGSLMVIVATQSGPISIVTAVSGAYPVVTLVFTFGPQGEDQQAPVGVPGDKHRGNRPCSGSAGENSTASYWASSSELQWKSGRVMNRTNAWEADVRLHPLRVGFYTVHPTAEHRTPAGADLVFLERFLDPDEASDYFALLAGDGCVQ